MDSHHQLRAALVIDNGSDSFKAGFAGELSPRSVVSSVVGVDACKGSTYVGSQVTRELDGVCLKYPIEHGVITDWEALELVWGHVSFPYCVIQPNQRQRNVEIDHLERTSSIGY